MEAEVTGLRHGDRRPCQWFHLDPPLGGDERLDDGTTPVAVTDGVAVGLDFLQRAFRPQHFHDAFARLGHRQAIQLGELRDIHPTVEVQDGADLKVMALADLVIGDVVPGRHLDGAGAELLVHRFVGDDRHASVHDRQRHRLPDHVLVAPVIGMDGDRRVPHHRLRARRRDRDHSAAVDRVVEVIEVTVRLFVLDLEVEYEETDGHLYYLDYPVDGGGVISVATARPETMVGDTAVAVHPDDWRYKDMIGKSVTLPIVHRRVPIVADEAVDQEFGTGAVKVTPGHDVTDYEIGERHHLEVRTILHLDGRMNIPEVPELDGLPVPKARERIVEMLRAEGALQKIEPYRHSVGHCDRCGAVIEPLVSAQWWVKMKPLAGAAIAVAETGDLRFHPERWREQYLRWMHNIRDWNISRQLWLGHRIPVWTCANGHAIAYLKDPKECEQCGDRHLTQDPDVLDTWFSSSLWPFVTLGWPDDTEDLRRFYPTQVLDSGRDILYLWIARMVFMSLHFLNVVPFSDVLIHTNVLASDGRRMSKSLGTGVDPLDLIDRYGADATRAWAAYFGTSGQDLRFSKEKIKAYQLFANKLWNATRLLVAKLPEDAAPLPIDEAELEPADTWILGRLSAVTRLVTSSFERLEFGPAIDGLYDFAWKEVADDYLELIKPRLQAGDTSTATALSVAIHVLETILRLLHPIMPFVTEELWQRLPHEGETIMYAPWPLADETIEDRQLMDEMGHLLEVVRAVRNLRHTADPRVRRQPAEISSPRPLLTEPIGRRYLATLAQLELNGKLVEGTPQAVVVVGRTTVRLGLPADGGAEVERLRGELQKRQREIDAIEA